MVLHKRRMKPTKWVCPSMIATLGIGHDFNLLCINVFQNMATYHHLTLVFLSTLKHTVGLNAGGEDEWITFHLMDQSFGISLMEWCNHFGFPNNDEHYRYICDMLKHHPLELFCRMNYQGYKHRASYIECPSICYLYYIITNSLQAQGEVSKVNEENMIILGKAANPHIDYTPNLGAIFCYTFSTKPIMHKEISLVEE
jgi:hypothetical protein